jgi:ABC-type Fe3+ transport system substrate-binding protein
MKPILTILSSAVIGTALLAATTPAHAQSAFDKLLAASKAEVEKNGGTIKMALDWPEEDAAPVLAAYQKDFPYVKKFDYERETGIDGFGRYLISIQQGQFPPYDVMHIASEYEQQYLKANAFIKPPFDLKEVDGSLPKEWPHMNGANIDPQGYFVATTGNTRGIVYNKDQVKGADIPTKWADCVAPKWKGKMVVDARNKLQAFQYDPKTREQFLKLFDDMVKNDVVFLRGQDQVVNKVAAGEYPIGCGVNYHTAYRAIETQGAKTLGFTYGESIPLEIATRLFVTKWTKMPATSELFAIWSATKGQEAIGKYAWRGFPWNPLAHNYEASKGKYVALCDADCALHFEEFDKEYEKALKIPTAGK